MVGACPRCRGTFLCTAALNAGSTFCAWRLLRQRVLAQRGLKRVASDPSLLADPAAGAPEVPVGPGLGKALAQLSSRASSRIPGGGRGASLEEPSVHGKTLGGRGVAGGVGSRVDGQGDRGKAPGGRKEQRAALEVAPAPGRVRTAVRD